MFSNEVNVNDSGVEEPVQNMLLYEVINDGMMESSQNAHFSQSPKFRLSQITSSDDIYVATPDVSELTISISSSDDPLRDFKHLKEHMISSKEASKPTVTSELKSNDEHSKISLMYDILKKILESQEKIINSLDTKFQNQEEYFVEQKKFHVEKWSKAGVAYKRSQDTMSDIKEFVKELADEIVTCQMKFSELFKNEISNYIDRYVDKKLATMNQNLEKLTEICRGFHEQMVTKIQDIDHSHAIEVQKLHSGIVSSIGKQMEGFMKDTAASTINHIMEILDHKKPYSQLIKVNNGHLPMASPSSSIGGCKPISRPISAYVPRNGNTNSASLNNSFQGSNSSDHKRETNNSLNDIHFISKRKHNVRDMIFQKKPFTSKYIPGQSGPVYQRTLKPLDMNVAATGQKRVYESAPKKDNSMQIIVLNSQKSQITESTINNNVTASQISVTDPKRIKLEAKSSESPSTAKIMTLKTKTSENIEYVPPPNSKEKSSNKDCSIPPAYNSKKANKLRSQQKSIPDDKKPKESLPEAVPEKKISPMTEDDSDDCVIIDEVYNPPSNSNTVSKAPPSKRKSRVGRVKSGTVPFVLKEKPEEYFTKCFLKNIKVEKINPDDNNLDTGSVFKVRGN